MPLTGGSGSGATANITVTAGVVTNVVLTSGGSLYVVGDILSASQASLGVGSGFQITVSDVTNTTNPGVGLGWDPATPTGPGGNNASGFSGLPGGYRNTNGGFTAIRSNAVFWSATGYGSSSAWDRGLNYLNGFVFRDDSSKSDGASVRCLRD